MTSKSVNQLPEGYELDYSLDLNENKKLFIKINLLAVLLLVPLVILFFLIIAYTSKEVFNNSMESESGKYLYFLIGVVLYIIIHELIHALFFRFASKGKLKFTFNLKMASASIPDAFFYKKPYLMAGLAPAVIMSVIFIVLLILTDGTDFFLVYMLFLIHVCGCIGDFYVSWKLRKYPEDTLIQDYGMGMRFFIKNR